MKNLLIKIGLSAAIIVLGYLVAMSILEPVKFQDEKVNREKIVIGMLKDIRSVETVYKTQFGKYMGSFDTLIEFMKVGEIPVVNIIADPNDTTFTKTINDTIAYINVSDSLFGDRENFNANQLRFVPFSGGVEFKLTAGKKSLGNVSIPVFEIKALFADILKGMDEQLIRNLIKKKEELEKFPGLKVGSMEEASTDGNWEY